MKDYYFILGVASSAGNSEIKEAFRKLCLKYHPDRTVINPHNHQRYMEICEAYRVLSNKNKRASYDRRRLAPQDQSLKDGLYPELKRSYKGFFPWLAAFAIIIVALLALVFVNNSGNSFTQRPPTQAAKITVASTPAHPAVTATRVDTVSAPSADTAAAIIPTDTAAAINTDSINKRAELAKIITTTLSQNTAPAAPGSADDRNYDYSFSGDKLIVKYNSGPRGQANYMQVAIPANDIKSVYCYAGKLWINTKGKSIRSRNLDTKENTRTNVFSIRVNEANAPELEKQLSEAIAGLKSL